MFMNFHQVKSFSPQGIKKKLCHVYILSLSLSLFVCVVVVVVVLVYIDLALPPSLVITVNDLTCG